MRCVVRLMGGFVDEEEKFEHDSLLNGELMEVLKNWLDLISAGEWVGRQAAEY